MGSIAFIQSVQGRAQEGGLNRAHKEPSFGRGGDMP